MTKNPFDNQIHKKKSVKPRAFIINSFTKLENPLKGINACFINFPEASKKFSLEKMKINIIRQFTRLIIRYHI